MKNKITTQFGDKGQSYLFNGEVVAKHHPLFHALGDVDELVSVLGIAKHEVKPMLKKVLTRLQKKLFVVGSEIATPNNQKLMINEQELHHLETFYEQFYEQTIIPEDFVVPGKTKGSAYLDHARTIARRLERQIVDLNQQQVHQNPFLLKWINRLSDFLFILARYEEGEPEYVKDIDE